MIDNSKFNFFEYESYRNQYGSIPLYFYDPTLNLIYIDHIFITKNFDIAFHDIKNLHISELFTHFKHFLLKKKKCKLVQM